MDQQQKWRVRTRIGNEFDLFTPLTYGPEQAVNSAGLWMSQIEWIRPMEIVAVER